MSPKCILDLVTITIILVGLTESTDTSSEGDWVINVYGLLCYVIYTINTMVF